MIYLCIVHMLVTAHVICICHVMSLHPKQLHTQSFSVVIELTRSYFVILH